MGTLILGAACGIFSCDVRTQLRHVGFRSLTRIEPDPCIGSHCTSRDVPVRPPEQSLFPTALDLLPNISPAVFQSQISGLIFLEQEVRSLWARGAKWARSSCFWKAFYDWPSISGELPTRV